MLEAETITLPKQLADDALDYLYELRGEWRWKESCHGRNKTLFSDLTATIEKLESATGRLNDA